MPEATAPRARPRSYPAPVPVPGEGAAPVRAGVGWTRYLSEGGAAVELPDRLAQTSSASSCRRAGAPSSWRRGALERGARFGGAASPWAGLPRLSRSSSTRSELLLPPTSRSGTPSPPARRGRGRWKPKAARAPLPGSRAMSAEGLLLRLPQAITPGTLLEVTLEFATEPLSAEGTIVWVEPRNTAGRGADPPRHAVHRPRLERAAGPGALPRVCP
jgi:hypothetical protein